MYLAAQTRAQVHGNRGFTLVELLLAMSVFSMMLLIVVAGFINIVRLHNQAIAINIAQDNARTAMDVLVQAVRNSSGVSTIDTSNPDTYRMCLNVSGGQQQLYYVTAGILYRADGCSTLTNVRTLTGSDVLVTSFKPEQQPSNAAIPRPQIELSLTVASNGAPGLTTGTGSDVQCGTAISQRTFCSVVTLKSGATPR